MTEAMPQLEHWHDHLAHVLWEIGREPGQDRLILAGSIARVYRLRAELGDHLAVPIDLPASSSAETRAATVLLALYDTVGRSHPMRLLIITAWRFAMQLAKTSRAGQDKLRAAYDLGLAMALEDKREALAALEAAHQNDLRSRLDTANSNRAKEAAQRRERLRSFALGKIKHDPFVSDAAIARDYRAKYRDGAGKLTDLEERQLGRMRRDGDLPERLKRKMQAGS